MHVAFAHFGGPHWLLNDDDAKAYATAVNNVARHYDVAIAQRTIDICNLVGMAAWIEGTRFLYSRSGAPQRQQQPQRGQVVPFMQFSPPASGQVHPTTVAPPTTPAPEPFGPPLPTGTDTPEGGALH